LKIFVLEDDKFRTNFIKQHLKAAFTNPEIIFTDNADEAFKILTKSNFDILCLDHDLGGEVFVNSEEPNTGYQVAKFISENKIKYDKCIVHSLNYPGAMRMTKLLDRSIYLPILMWTKDSLEYINNIK
jgi:CheY-like chemotaxis protein